MTEEKKATLVRHKLLRAKETIREAELLVNNEMWNAAVNRMDYACFYAVTALLVSNDVKTKKHAGVIQMFGLYFVNTGLFPAEAGRFYALLFDMRQSGDYTDYLRYEQGDVVPLLQPTVQFIQRIEEAIST